MLYVCVLRLLFFLFKQKTAYEMRISDWSSDVCPSDLQYRDRNCLSHQRHARGALRRRHAGKAFRAAGIDWYRQIDLSRADPAQDMRSGAARAYRHDRSAWRI